MNNKIRLIASDLDGCLLDGSSSLPPDFGETLHLMEENDVIFAASSGRSINGARMPFGKYADEIAIIADNGVGAYYRGECLFKRTLDTSCYIPVMEEMRKNPDLFPVICGESSIWIEDPGMITPEISVEFSKYFSTWKQSRFEEIPEKICKMTVLYLGDIEKDIYPSLKRFEDETICVQVTARIWIDMYEKGISKGTGIKALQEYFRITPEETAVFGDYINDISMADHAKYSFAPANAHPDVRNRFSETIRANTEHGVTEKIKDLLRPQGREPDLLQ